MPPAPLFAVTCLKAFCTLRMSKYFFKHTLKKNFFTRRCSHWLRGLAQLLVCFTFSFRLILSHVVRLGVSVVVASRHKRFDCFAFLTFSPSSFVRLPQLPFLRAASRFRLTMTSADFCNYQSLFFVLTAVSASAFSHASTRLVADLSG